MLELMLHLEFLRQRLAKGMLPIVGDNSYHLAGSILALVFAGGTLGTAFLGAPATVPIGGLSFVALLASGLVSILTIVLFPVGLLLV
jgi:hypothetical protein